LSLDSLYYDNLTLPGADTNPARYKLPPTLIRSSFEFPSVEEIPPEYYLPQQEERIQIELPPLEEESGMELSRIPGPYRETVKFIHRGISPMVANGFVYLSTDGSDIHHIVKRATLLSGLDYTRAFLPFNGAVRQTFEMLMTSNQGMPKWVSGNLLINFIPLDYSFHHKFIEERPYDHTVFVRYRNERHAFTLPEILMAFAVFNLESRLSMLTNFVQRRHDRIQPIAEALTQQECIDPMQRNVPKDYAMWQRILIEIPRIPVVADELRADYPILFSIWEAALGPRAESINPAWMIEQ